MSVGFWVYPSQAISKILGKGLFPFLLVTKNLSILDVSELSTYLLRGWFRLRFRLHVFSHAPIVLGHTEDLLHHLLEILVGPKFQRKSVDWGVGGWGK